MAKRPCLCDRCCKEPGCAYTPDQCRPCWLWWHDPAYRALWGGGPATPPPSLLRRAGNLVAATAKHVAGGLVNVAPATRALRLAACETCPTYWDAAKRRCNHCGCNMDRKSWSAALECPIGRWPAAGPLGAEPPSVRGTRHLAYHLCPMRGNGTWQRNVEQLKRRLHLFDGRRCVAVVTGPGLDSPDAVRQQLGSDVEYVILPNNRALREVVTFVPLLERVLRYAGIGDMTFYAHAKGVTRPVDPGVTVHTWTEIMYATCLDYWPVADRLLRLAPMVGTFKKIGRFFEGSVSRWHWSGSFWWMRNRDVAKRDWRRVDQQWWGAESWPGLHFAPAEARELLIADGGRLDLYHMPYLRDTVMPALVAFQQRHAGAQTKVPNAQS